MLDKDKKNDIMPVLWGGLGAKMSNSGTQWFQQDRIYDSEYIAMAHPASIPGGSYMYVVRMNGTDKHKT